jgi:hypothetical protein
MLDGVKSGYQKFDLELRLIVTGGGSAPQYSTSGNIISYYTPDYVFTVPGVELSGGRGGGSSVYSSANLTIDALGIDEDWTSTSDVTVTQLVQFEGLRLITMPSGVWRLTGDSITYIVNGTTVYTHGSFTLTSAMAPTPAAVPLFGCPFFLFGSASYGPVAVTQCLGDTIPTPRAYTSSGEITGGYRVNIDGTWVIAPIDLVSSSIPDIVEADDCWTVTINALANETATASPPKIAIERETGNCLIVPNFDTEMVRMQPGHEEIVYRWGLPEWEITTTDFTRQYTCDTDTEVITDNNSSSVLYSLDSVALFNAGDTEHAFEDPITRSKKSLIIASRSTVDMVPSNYTEGFFGTGIDTTPDTSTTPATLLNGDITNRWRAIYANTIMSPFTSYGVWFPPDSASSAVRWDLLGTDSLRDYWEQIRQQHATHPSLPSGENTRRRVNLVSQPVAQSGVAGIPENLIGLRNFWGVDQLGRTDTTFPTEFTTDSSSATRFAFKNGATPGTGTVGASITIDAGSDAVEFDTTSFTVFPYMTTTLSDRIKITWSDANISAVKVFAVGVDGTSKQIGPTAGVVSATTYRIPFGDSEKWATSAGAEFGASYLTDDYTPDAGVSADDITSATLADEERISSFGLLPGYSPAKIRIEITRAGAYTGAVTIAHPTFYQAPWTDAKVFHEQGHVSTVLFKNGPMVRYGALGFFDYIFDTILSTPIPVADVLNKTTIGDMWCWENLFLAGNAATTGLTTRLPAEFVVNEEYPAGVTKHLWRFVDEEENFYIDSISFIPQSSSKPSLIYYSTWRGGVANFWMLPAKKLLRSSDFDDAGEFGQYRYTLGQSKQPHIVPGNTLPSLIHSSTDHLQNETSVDGWTVRTFSEAVTNNESQSWMFKWSGVNWFEMRPWRGQVFMGMASEEAGEPLTYDVLQNLRHCLGYIKSGTAWLSHSESNSPYSWVDIDTTETADYFDIAYHDGSGDLYLSIVDAGAITLYKTSDEGGTLTTVMTLGSGDYSAIEWTPNNLLYAYRLDSGGTLYGRVLDAAGNTIVSETATNLTGLDQAPFDVRVSVNSSQKQVIGATYKLGGNRLFKTAPDGFTFS